MNSTSASLHVLTITPFYPTVENNASGCFVAEPLQAMTTIDPTIRHTVIAVQPFYRGEIELDPSAIQACAVRFFSLPSGYGLPTAGFFLFVRLLSQVRAMHAANPISLIHAHSALPCGHAAALLSRELDIPFVVTVHGLDAYSTNQVRGLAGRWCASISRWVYRNAKTVICVSEHVRGRVLQGSKASMKTAVIYNGVDENFFSPSMSPDESRFILSVGGLIPIKDHALLIRAFAAIAYRFSTYSLAIIGEGPERDRLETLARQLKIPNRVRFLGHQSRAEVATSMRGCALFALPSNYEALGCVYLEAMSSGKPAIGCHGQGIEEIIHDGYNGFLIHANSVDDLTGVLTRLLENDELTRRVGIAARETILEGFTLAHQATQLSQLYRESVQ
jgi:glycosyltransferase involved in cell wall biosynthesis